MFIFVVKLHKNNETEKLFPRFFINDTKVKNSVKTIKPLRYILINTEPVVSGLSVSICTA